MNPQPCYRNYLRNYFVQVCVIRKRVTSNIETEKISDKREDEAIIVEKVSR